MQTHITLKSSNKKTGKIPVTTTTRKSCPDKCPLKKGGCYANDYHLSMHWNKVTSGERGGNFAALCRTVKSFKPDQLWRHNQAGDLAGINNKIDAKKLLQLTAANKGKKGFTYTHKPMTADNMKAVKQANDAGFTVNLSANNRMHADVLADLNIAPVVTILPADHISKISYTPKGRKIVTCPATIQDNVTCEQCGLCQHQRDYIIGFPVHGSSKNKAALNCDIGGAL